MGSGEDMPSVLTILDKLGTLVNYYYFAISFIFHVHDDM